MNGLLGAFQTAYVPCPASSTTPLGSANGGPAQGDIISLITIIPGTTSPGSVQIKDGTGTAITVFLGGATSVADLKPFTIFLGIRSRIAGGWSIITGANVTAVAAGAFS